MPFDHDWTFSWLDRFRHEDIDFNLMLSDFLVRRLVQVEAIEASSGGSAKRHIGTHGVLAVLMR
jgi:hypothetical protein